jgi:hypothetical protein
MSKNRAQYIKIGVIAMTISLSACKKLVEINPPLNETPSAAIFASDRTAVGALSGMYAYFAQATAQNVDLTVNSSLMADDLNYGGLVTAQVEYASNAYLVNTASTEAFSSWYALIYRANAIIVGLQEVAGTTEAVKTRLTAEAKIIRAYSYFNLVNLYGGVPLVVSTDANVTAFLPRESPENVYRQMIADLTDAKANLAADYSATANSRAGVNKFTASALLARIYLYTGDYAAAELNASEVIASNLYRMTPSATIRTALFISNSAESIWQLPAYLNATNLYTAEAGTLVPFSATSAINYSLSPGLLAVFPANDLRRAAWMSSRVFGGTTYTIPFKYKYRDNASATTAGVSESQVIMRLAEQYLIRAEARARLSNTAGALGDLNVIRLRAGLEASTTTAAATLLDEIALENRREFFCEQGFRWNNLRRTGQADAVLGVLKPTYRPEAKLYPFAQSIINVNTNLVQNPGY